MIYIEKPSCFTANFEIVSCFLERDGKILLLHRHDHKSQVGRWGVPAGKVEKGELLHGAMTREIAEETGLYMPLHNLQYFKKVYVMHPEHNFVYHMFHADAPVSFKEVVINNYEHKGFRWAFPNETVKMNLVMDLDQCIEMFYGKIA